MKNYLLYLFFIILLISCEKKIAEADSNQIKIIDDSFSKIDSKIFIKNSEKVEVLLSSSTNNEKLGYTLNMKLEMKTNTDFTVIPEASKKNLEFEVVKITMDTLKNSKVQSGEYLIKDKLIITSSSKQLLMSKKEVKITSMHNPNQISKSIISFNLKYR